MIHSSDQVKSQVIKGGTLVSSMVGAENRETMDIDTSISGFNLDEDTLKRILLEIANIPMEDGMTFKITKVKQMMDKEGGSLK